MKSFLLTAILVLAIPMACWSQGKFYLMSDPPDPSWNITRCEVEITRNGQISYYISQKGDPDFMCDLDPNDPTDFRFMEVTNLQGGQYNFRARWFQSVLPSEWCTMYPVPPSYILKPGQSGNIRIK